MEEKRMNLNQAIHIMKTSVTDKYAQAYLAVLDEAIDEDGSEGLAKQLSYVISNLSNWKGKEAKEVKAFVKNWIERKLDECNNLPK
jgi:hypothetical protein